MDLLKEDTSVFKRYHTQNQQAPTSSVVLKALFQAPSLLALNPVCASAHWQGGS